MNRKKFLGSLLPLGLPLAGLSGFPLKSTAHVTDPGQAKIPPYLKPGDSIGITSPAGFILNEDIQPAFLKMQEWGFRVKIGNSIGKKDFSQGGTAAERLEDLQQMLDDKSIKAIMGARGGYGSVQLIDQINFDHYEKNPKCIIGFSDITVLHSHINRNFNIATIHSKMCNSFPADWSLAEQVQKDSIQSIFECLSGKKMSYNFSANTSNKKGKATGQLVGGNLKTIESLTGTASDLITDNKILFVEDTGEYLYSLDRMFWHLKRSGKLAHLKALIIGGFKVKPDDPGEEFGKTLEQIVLEKVSKYNYPVCFDFPVGHQKNNLALKCGVVHELTVSERSVQLSEM